VKAPVSAPVAPQSAAAPAAPAGPTTAAAEEAWKAAVDKFAAERPMEAETIRAVQFHTCKADLVEVMLPMALEKKIHYLRSPRNLELLEQALAEKLGRKLSLVFILGDGRKAVEAVPASGAASAKPAPPAPNMSQEAFLNDPVIQNALKIFEAKVVNPARP
jgi:DNA polymerase-3 subunit gamma/tau